MQLSQTIIALAALSGASAFSPSSRPSPASKAIRSEAVDATPVAPRASARTELEDFAKNQGIPNFIFDPLELADQEYFGEDNDATIGFIRQAELKHGRVAMAGFVGFLVHQQGITWPFAMTMDGQAWPKLEEVGSVPALWDAIPEGGKWQIILFVGILEWWDEYQFEPEKNTNKPKHYMRGGRPGDYPDFFGNYEGKEGNFLPLNLFDPFKFAKKMTPEQSAKRRVMEVNNGRMAMVGLFSLLAESKLEGSVPLIAGKLPHYDGAVMAPFEANFHLFN
jgi:hypothetical protein